MQDPLTVPPTRVRVIQAPDYVNRRIDSRDKWIQDNYALLQEYWDELGNYVEEPLDPVADAKAFKDFCLRQHENTENALALNRVEQELLRRDEAYDRARPL